QFLLDNAHFYVATFIKGPVCNGSAAVNSIQEQFYVLFLKPDADSMVMQPDFAAAAVDKLILPGAWGSDIDLLQDLPSLTRIVTYREDYRSLRARSVRKLRPDGYALSDVWDGDGSNANALLTVFRHDDNAAVFKGA
ncbi:fatty acid cis/trans isomerase, partial [Microbacteriaceae bacterium K1510]|nr:fatty acid cis/trans isomerase [Microbacteriaceae bacterium K1510]